MAVYDSEIKMEQKTNFRMQFTLAAALSFSLVQRQETAVTDEFSEMSHISGIKFHYTTIPLSIRKLSDSLYRLYFVFRQCIILQKVVLNAGVITGETFGFIIFRFTSGSGSVFERLELVFLHPFFVRIMSTLLSSDHVH